MSPLHTAAATARGRIGLLLLGATMLLDAATALALRSIPCSADCDGDDRVAINEVIGCVNIALGGVALDTCLACDADHSGAVTIDELVLAVSSSLGICHGDAFCPLVAGTYTLTQVDGGTMRLGTFTPWPFPSGGTLVLDVGVGEPPDCLHGVVVPPDGFNVPTFCIPATGLSVRVIQAGCGVGQIDSNGGADYTVIEVGDTSDGSATCNLPNPGCPPGPPSMTTLDAAARVDVRVGDGSPDECSSGAANMILAVPVRTIIWSDRGGLGYSCPAEDGTYDPEDGDILVAEFAQVLDVTTGATTATWDDLDGDGCALAGTGPADSVLFSGSGACLDLDAKTVTTVAAAPVGSAMVPLRDVTDILTVPYTLSGPEAPLGVTCSTAPAINLRGLATRCLE